MPWHIKHHLNMIRALPTRQWLLAVCLPTVSVAAVAVLLSGFFRDIDDQRIHLEFETETDRVANRLREKLDVYHEVVQSIASFYAGSRNVSRDEFAAFGRRALAHHRGIDGLEWVPRVSARDRDDWERAARMDGLADFQFKRYSGDRTWHASDQHRADDYFPVFYVQPQVGNEPALGIDLGSDPRRRAAMESSRDTGLAVATGSITLVQRNGSQLGFLLFVPVYENDAPTDTVEQRQEHLSGFALGVFRIAEIVDGINDRLLIDRFELQIADEDGRLIYDSANPDIADIPDTATNTVVSGWRSDPEYRHTIECSVGGQHWRLHFVGSPEWIQSRRHAMKTPIVLGGCIIALLLGLVLDSMLGRAKRVEQLVRRRTMDMERANQIARQHRDELTEAKQILERSNQQLKEFAFAASHDLQTPLRGISLFATFLQDEYSTSLDETANGYIRRIVSGAERMRRLILDLLEYSRVESQTQSLQPLRLNAVFDDVITLLETDIATARADVTRDNLPVVNGDGRQISQLFRNLIANSLKYRRGPGVRIHVAAEQNEMWSISIRDNGIGIDRKFHGQIFDIFRRLHTEQEYPGTGIGLALARRIVRHHGGEIRVESEIGNGCTFVFTLPRDQRDDASLPEFESIPVCHSV